MTNDQKAVIETARGANPLMPQREIARKLYDNTLPLRGSYPDGYRQIMFSVPQATIYGAIRRLDKAKTVKPVTNHARRRRNFSMA